MGAATDEFGLHSGPEHGKDHAKDHAAKEHSRAEGRCRQKEHHDRKKGPQFKVKYGLAARFIKAEKDSTAADAADTKEDKCPRNALGREMGHRFKKGLDVAVDREIGACIQKGQEGHTHDNGISQKAGQVMERKGRPLRQHREDTPQIGHVQ